MNEPAFSELFISHLLARNIRVEEDLVDQLFNSSEKRLARALLLLANFGKESKPEPVIAKISQETLAEMIGTTRSRVSFFMNKFRDLGFIDVQRPHRGPQFAVERGSAREARNQRWMSAGLPVGGNVWTGKLRCSASLSAAGDLFFVGGEQPESN